MVAGGRVTGADDPGLPDLVAGADLVLDGLLGIGGRGGLREPMASLAAMVHAARSRAGTATAAFSGWVKGRRPAATQEKIEEIKDLYLTAEAIGEDALGKHFDQLHQRQRSLIREFFEKAGLGSTDTPTPLGGDSAQNGASSAS